MITANVQVSYPITIGTTVSPTFSTWGTSNLTNSIQSYTPAWALRTTKHNRETGTSIQITRTYVNEKSAWHYTVTCLDHQRSVSGQTRRFSERQAARPRLWCEDCRAWWEEQRKDDF